MSFLHFTYAIVVAVIWGANFVASKFALEHFPPLFATLLRFAALSIMLVPFVPRPNRQEAWHLLMLALLGVAHFALPQAALAVGLDIATCAILTQLSVPFACVCGVFFMNDRIGKWRLLGLILAFGGMVEVMGAPRLDSSWLGSIYATAAAFFFGVYNVLIKRQPQLTAMQILAYVCLFGLPPLMALSVWLEAPSPELLGTAPMFAWIGISFTVIFSSIVGHGLWNYLIQQHPVSKVAPFTLLVPIFGVAIGQVFYREPLTVELLIGGAITLVGVAIIVMRRPKILEKPKAI